MIEHGKKIVIIIVNEDENTIRATKYVHFFRVEIFSHYYGRYAPVAPELYFEGVPIKFIGQGGHLSILMHSTCTDISVGISFIPFKC